MRSRRKVVERNRIRRGKSTRKALRLPAVFVGGFLATVMVGLIWASGVQPLVWLETHLHRFEVDRARPLTGQIRVVDGDTIRVAGERIRIANIDTPEMPPRSRCAAEAILAGRAKSNLEAMVAQAYEAHFIPSLGRERDAYGRLLGRVELDGVDVGRAQLEAGLAQRWMGQHAQWC